MKHLIKAVTPRSIRKFFTRLGRFYSAPEFPSVEGAFNTLKRMGWVPKACIDVGAYHGKWALMFKEIFPDSKVLMIEGQDEKKERLKEVVDTDPGNLFYEIALLGATEGATVNFSIMETGSSVFEENSPYPRESKALKLIELDNLLVRHPEFINANVLKLDTQGYELEIMKGALSLLEKVEVILLEVSLLQINKGAPQFSEMIEFLSSHDFKLFDFCSQIRRKDGVLWQTDLMFIRKGAIPNLEERLTAENWG